MFTANYFHFSVNLMLKYVHLFNWSPIDLLRITHIYQVWAICIDGIFFSFFPPFSC